MNKIFKCLLASTMVFGLATTTIYANAENNEAKIGNQEYGTLEEALNAAESGNTVELLTDATIDNAVDQFGSIYVKDGVTLDGNSKKITVTGKVSGIVLNGTSTLKNVTVENDENGKYNVQAYMGEAKIENVTIVDKSEGFAGVLVNGSNTTISNVTYNGSSYAAVELGKGDVVTNNPMLTINGELETGSTKAVYLSTNDNITDKTLNDLVKVNDNVTFAIDAEGNKVVAEASLNGVNYASLNDALESAQAGQTVKLLTDVKVAGVEALNGGLFVNDGVTLDGNNKKNHCNR